MLVHKALGFMIAGGVSKEPVPGQYTPGVSIGHKDWALGCIEDDGVNRFGPQTPEL
jgi:hypothetical protein